MSDLNLGEEHFHDPESSTEAEMAYEKKCIDQCTIAMSEGAPCNCGYHHVIDSDDLPPGWTRNDDGKGDPICPRCSTGDHDHHRVDGTLYDCKELPPTEYWFPQDEESPICPYQCCCKEYEVMG